MVTSTVSPATVSAKLLDEGIYLASVPVRTRGGLIAAHPDR